MGGTAAGGSLFFTAIGEAELRFGVAIMPAGSRRDALAAEIDGMLREEFARWVLPFDGMAAGMSFSANPTTLRPTVRPSSKTRISQPPYVVRIAMSPLKPTMTPGSLRNASARFGSPCSMSTSRVRSVSGQPRSSLRYTPMRSRRSAPTSTSRGSRTRASIASATSTTVVPSAGRHVLEAPVPENRTSDSYRQREGEHRIEPDGVQQDHGDGDAPPQQVLGNFPQQARACSH